MFKFLFLIIIYLFAFSYEKKTESNCNAEFLGCNVKCGVLYNKDDYLGIYQCTTKCEREYKKCLKSIKK